MDATGIAIMNALPWPLAWIVFSIYWVLRSITSAPAIIGAFICMTTAWILIPMQQQSSQEKGKQKVNVVRQWWFTRVLHVLAVATCCILVNTEFSGPQPLSLWPHGAGIAVAWTGVAFAIWSRWILGKEWRLGPEVRSDHNLITYGPFAHVRHPIYTGVMLIFTGAAIYHSHWINITAAFVSLGLYIQKLTEEEKLLQKGFGNKYKDYSQQTPFKLIPYIY
eukprot:TRINITY_DN9414_c0_g1_i1.p1 TRINITY_DN9414_c0_g1~~TRINITY_DN9414_c0_g1_i1.p1  ORF type:complete len:221 (-),score=21.97 TRINITY_DN9414_c0_g1_i1:195-857(-)